LRIPAEPTPTILLLPPTSNGPSSSIVISAGDPSSVSTGILNRGLSCQCSTGTGRSTSTAALTSSGALGPGKVPSPVNQDNTGSAVRDPLLESTRIRAKLDGVAGVAEPPPVVSVAKPNAAFHLGTRRTDTDTQHGIEKNCLHDSVWIVSPISSGQPILP
jgi:hypothetical protein